MASIITTTIINSILDEDQETFNKVVELSENNRRGRQNRSAEYSSKFWSPDFKDLDKKKDGVFTVIQNCTDLQNVTSTDIVYFYHVSNKAYSPIFDFLKAKLDDPWRKIIEFFETKPSFVLSAGRSTGFYTLDEEDCLNIQQAQEFRKKHL